MSETSAHLEPRANDPSWDLTGTFNIINTGKANLLPKSFISPIFIMWDITYACPFNCIFCFNNSGGVSSRNELPESELLQIAEDIAREQVVSVCLCGGEPFARFNEFLKISQKLSDAGVIVNCVSNGWYITSDILEKIKGKIKTIQFSLDAPDPQTHDYIRGKKGAFERVMKAIDLVSRSSLKKCELTFVPTRINYHSFADVVKLAVDLGCITRIRTQHLIHTGRGHNLDISLNPEEKKEFEELFVQAHAKYSENINLVFGDPWSHINDWQKDVIPPLFLQITAYGLAKISPYIPLAVGNLTQEPLSLIWKRVNNNRTQIKRFLSSYKTMNVFPDSHIPWIDNDLEFKEEIL